MNNELKEMLESVIHTALEPVIERLDKLEGRFDKLEGRFDKLEDRFDALEGRFDKLEVEFSSFRTEVNTRFDKLEEKVDGITKQVASNTEVISEIRGRLAQHKDLTIPFEKMEQRMDEFALDMKVLKKAVAY